MNSLDVLIDGKFVGILHNSEPLGFSFSDDCLAGLTRNPFAAVIPLQAGVIDTPSVLACFENLLPEGDQRRALQQLHHVSTVFGLLAKAGWDTAGAIVLRPRGDVDVKASYVKKSWADIARIIEGLDPHHGASKVSISGAQYKLLLSLDDEGNPLLPVGAAPTTHILKPNIQRTGQKIWASAINETVVMRTAAKCGLPVAHVDYVAPVKSCLVQRYDRIVKNGVVLRMGQSDLCQLLAKPSSVKYETDGGPDFASCYARVRVISMQPVVDCENLVKWIFFNLYTGNNDGHAKNLSMLQQGSGYKLAPFYDLMCTTVYPGFSRNFAFSIGTTFKPGDIDNKQLQALAAAIGVSEKLLRKMATDLPDKIAPALHESVEELRGVMGPSETTMVARLVREITSICKKRTARLLGLA